MRLPKKYIIPILLPIQILILQLLSFFPDAIEKYYSNGLYPKIAWLSRNILGNISFSIGDIIYLILVFLAIKWFWRSRKKWKSQWKLQLLSIISAISVFYFSFTLLWGFNYLRIPLYQKLSIDREYNETELETFTLALIHKTNSLQLQLAKNDTIAVVIPYTLKEIYTQPLPSYQNLELHYSFFKYKNESIKSSLLSLPLSYMGFSGYLNPFTNEAQVNNRIPKYNLPVTTCHEIAHQIGYASESEANFIGFMATIHSTDLYFQYSGYSFALRYCLNTLEKIKPNSSKKFLPLIHKGVLNNYSESKLFWENHQTFLEPVFKIFYDNFLKVNQQKDGMEGYSKFVGLLIGHYRQTNFEL